MMNFSKIRKMDETPPWVSVLNLIAAVPKNLSTKKDLGSQLHGLYEMTSRSDIMTLTNRAASRTPWDHCRTRAQRQNSRGPRDEKLQLFALRFAEAIKNALQDTGIRAIQSQLQASIDSQKKRDEKKEARKKQQKEPLHTAYLMSKPMFKWILLICKHLVSKKLDLLSTQLMFEKGTRLTGFGRHVVDPAFLGALCGRKLDFHFIYK